MTPFASDDEILDHYVSVAEMIAATLTPIAETVVNDIRPNRNKVRAIFNGHITGRKPGDDISDIGQKRIQKKVPDRLINYNNEGAHGRRLKSSAIAIRNSKGELIGSFGLNVDVSLFDGVQSVLEDLLRTGNAYKEKEQFFVVPPQLEIHDAIKDIVSQKGWSIPNLDREQKIEIIRILQEQGQLNKRHAVATIAKMLKLTRPSVYTYLKSL